MKNNENLKDNTILASDAEQTTTEQTPSNPGTAPDSLPAGYLAGGYYATTEKGAKYLRPEFVGKYAETMATLLAGMQITDFNRLLREMKRSKKKTLPFEARLTAVSEMLPKALALVHRKKAPALIVDWVKANQAAIKSDEDWYAYYRHLEAIAGYMIGGDT